MNPCSIYCTKSCCRPYYGNTKFKKNDRIKVKHVGSGVVTEVCYSDNSYRVRWTATNNCSWVYERTMELDEPTDYRALIEAEVLKLEAEVKALEARADALKITLKMLDELDKK